MTVVGFSETEEAFSYTQEGVIDALFTQDNEELGWKSVELVEELVSGKTEGKTKPVIYIDMIPVRGGEGRI